MDHSHQNPQKIQLKVNFKKVQKKYQRPPKEAAKQRKKKY